MGMGTELQEGKPEEHGGPGTSEARLQLTQVVRLQTEQPRASFPDGRAGAALGATMSRAQRRVGHAAHLPSRDPMRGEARRLPGEEPSRPLSLAGLLPSSQPAGKGGREAQQRDEQAQSRYTWGWPGSRSAARDS